MASSVRPRPSTTSSRQNRGPVALPSYQPPQHPLNESAQRALQNLPRDHKLDSLKQRLRTANNHLTHAAADVNERLQSKNAQYEKFKKRQETQGSQENEEQDEVIAVARQQANDMTGNLEASVRMIIDSSAEVENVERALQELQENITEGRGRTVPTQSTLGASQYRQTRARRQQDLDSDEENESEDTQGPSGDDESAIGLLKRKVADKHSAYQAIYAHHNDYVGFKKIVHDAQYPEDQAPPLPHASTWFPSETPDPSNPNTNSQAAGDNDPIVDDDEDLVIAAERISVKCPITLLTMKDPVTSQKCQHSFEKEAILSMINASDMYVGGTGRGGAHGGQKAMKCPVCAVELTASDIKENPVLVRKIQRMQAAENAQHEELSEDEENGNQGKQSLFGGRRRAEAISSSPAATRTPGPKSERMKSERLSVAPGRQLRDVSMVPNSQGGDLVTEGRPSSSAATDAEDMEEDAED